MLLVNPLPRHPSPIAIAITSAMVVTDESASVDVAIANLINFLGHILVIKFNGFREIKNHGFYGLGVSLGVSFGGGPGVGPGVSPGVGPGVGLGLGLTFRCDCSNSRRNGCVLLVVPASSCCFHGCL